MKIVKMTLTAMVVVALSVGCATTKPGSSDEVSAETTSATTTSSGLEDPLAETRLVKAALVEAGSFSTTGTGAPNVTLTKRYYMGIYEVTQGQYKTVMGGVNPSNNDASDEHPVETVSWYDAVQFCNALSIYESFIPYYTIDGTTVTISTAAGADKGYRLPTEAEWEYAARGGQNTASHGFMYAGGDVLDDVAWNSSNSETSQPTGYKTGNALGLFDMSGNVLEWCSDLAAGKYPSAEVDPVGATAGTKNIMRGGAYNRSAVEENAVSMRRNIAPTTVASGLGFRVARSL